MEAVHAGAWAIGEAEPPDSLRTTTFYEALGRHCSPGGCAVTSALGAIVASNFLAPTVADHKANVIFEALRHLLGEQGREDVADAMVSTIAKYLGAPDKPFKMKTAPALNTSVQVCPTAKPRTNEKLFQKDRASTGRELGAEGLEKLKHVGLPPGIFRVAPTGRQLRQPEVTKIKDDVRKWSILHFDNLYADHEFLETLAGLLEVSHPKLNQRRGSDARSWKTVLLNGWENGSKSKVRALKHPPLPPPLTPPQPSQS